MSPIQRDGFDYEFTLIFDIQMDHRAIDKNRTGLFEGRVVDLLDAKVAKDLRGWLDAGRIPEPTPAVTTTVEPAREATVAAIHETIEALWGTKSKALRMKVFAHVFGFVSRQAADACPLPKIERGLRVLQAFREMADDKLLNAGER